MLTCMMFSSIYCIFFFKILMALPCFQTKLKKLFFCDVGQGGTEGKKALFHCNYCNKDISGKIRIKCSKCPDFDLCVECFSVGAEVTPHRSNHPYRVMVGIAIVMCFSLVFFASS